MHSIVLVQSGLKEAINELIRMDSVTCVEINGAEAGEFLPLAQQPLAISRKKTTSRKAIRLPVQMGGKSGADRLMRPSRDSDQTGSGQGQGILAEINSHSGSWPSLPTNCTQV